MYKKVNLIELNMSAQLTILDAVRRAYAHTSQERRLYASSQQRRRVQIASLLRAYNRFAAVNGGTLLTDSEMMAASKSCRPFSDKILADRCSKGMEFYQRLLTNVSKLLQRVKGVFININIILCNFYSI